MLVDDGAGEGAAGVVRFERDREFNLKKLKGLANVRVFIVAVVELVSEGLGDIEQDDVPSIDDGGEGFDGCCVGCRVEREGDALGEDFEFIFAKFSFRLFIVVVVAVAVVSNVSVLLLL